MFSVIRWHTEMGEEQVGTGVSREEVRDGQFRATGEMQGEKWMSILVASINVLDVEARVRLCLC